MKLFKEGFFKRLKKAMTKPIVAPGASYFRVAKNAIADSIVLRVLFYFAAVGAGFIALRFHDDLYGLISAMTSLQDNDIFSSALAIFLLTFPLVTVNWILKNWDITRQFRDTASQLQHSSKQLDYAAKQQAETLFSNALQLLFKDGDATANSVGLKELIRLRQNEMIAAARIDLITTSGITITNARLQWADLHGANLQDAKLQDAKLHGADLRALDIQWANLQGANLYGADIRGAKLQGADLQGAKLQGAELQGAKLQGANLYGANLQVAKLQGAKLQGTDLRDADLQGATYDDRTRFPDKFDPQDFGMIEVAPEDGA